MMIKGNYFFFFFFFLISALMGALCRAFRQYLSVFVTFMLDVDIAFIRFYNLHYQGSKETLAL